MSEDHQKDKCLETLHRLRDQVDAAIRLVEGGMLKVDKKAICMDGYRGEPISFSVGDFTIIDRFK